MLISFSLLAVAALAVPVEVAPRPIKVPLKYHHNVSSLRTLIDRGHARLEAFNSIANGGSLERRQGFYGPPSTGSATNEDITYVAPVTIGGRTWQLIVDTGSSNTWCGARTQCEPTSSGYSTGNSFGVTYGTASVSGTEYVDSVSYGSATTQQSIGSASSSSGIAYLADGIWGLGPAALTQGTVSNTGVVPTFMDNLYNNRQIPTEVVGVYFKPESGGDNNDNNGELTVSIFRTGLTISRVMPGTEKPTCDLLTMKQLGGIDTARYTGAISYFPKVTSGPAASYWGVSIAQYSYGAFQLGAGTGQGIVDTGTTLIYIPSSVYNYWLSATGGSTDPNSGYSSWPGNSPPTAPFGIKFSNNVILSLTSSQYLVPTAQYATLNLQPGKWYSWIYNGGTGSLNSIIGQKFLENYYSIYDTNNQRIGFATRT